MQQWKKYRVLKRSWNGALSGWWSGKWLLRTPKKIFLYQLKAKDAASQWRSSALSFLAHTIRHHRTITEAPPLCTGKILALLLLLCATVVAASLIFCFYGGVEIGETSRCIGGCSISRSRAGCQRGRRCYGGDESGGGRGLLRQVIRKRLPPNYNIKIGSINDPE